jgi:hypothetical protein
MVNMKSKKQKAESKNARAERAAAGGFSLFAFCFLLSAPERP